MGLSDIPHHALGCLFGGFPVKQTDVVWGAVQNKTLIDTGVVTPTRLSFCHYVMNTSEPIRLVYKSLADL